MFPVLHNRFEGGLFKDLLETGTRLDPNCVCNCLSFQVLALGHAPVLTRSQTSKL